MRKDKKESQKDKNAHKSLNNYFTIEVLPLKVWPLKFDLFEAIIFPIPKK